MKPLVPEDRAPSALRAAAVASVARAALNVARNVRGRSVKSSWPDDRNAELLTRAASTPASLANTTALQQVAPHFVASLVPVSAAAAVIARSLQLSFDGAAQIGVPALMLPSAAFVGDGMSIPVAQGTSSPGAVITPAKLAAIIPLTNEMINHSNGEQMVRQVLVENIGPTLDAAMFSAAAAVPGVRPAGILDGVAALAPSGATAPVDAMVADVQALAEAITPAAGASQPVLIAAPAQAAALTLRAPRDLWPVLMSAALSAGTIIAVVPAAVATVVEAPEIEAGTDTVQTDDAPGELVDIGGVWARPVRSLWQTDSVGLRFVMPATWARRSASAVAWIESTSW
jgi:hypothetical protein